MNLAVISTAGRNLFFFDEQIWNEKAYFYAIRQNAHKQQHVLL
jgi:hypothetical protein